MRGNLLKIKAFKGKYNYFTIKIRINLYTKRILYNKTN